MGSSMCKPTYNRNELFAMMRDTKTYGINLVTYTNFINSQIYINSRTTPDNINDDSYINLWNQWKDTQECLNDLPDISTNIIIKIIQSPVVKHKYHLPKHHASYQKNTLKAFYKLQSWEVEIEELRGTPQFTLLQDIDNYINYILDNFAYYDIVQHIKEVYTLPLWNVSQMKDPTWRDIIIKINNSSHKDICELNLIQNICYDKSLPIWSELDKKIIL